MKTTKTNHSEAVKSVKACESAKCTPEFREDGKHIHYKRIVTK